LEHNENDHKREKKIEERNCSEKKKAIKFIGSSSFEAWSTTKNDSNARVMSFTIFKLTVKLTFLEKCINKKLCMYSYYLHTPTATKKVRKSPDISIHNTFEQLSPVVVHHGVDTDNSIITINCIKAQCTQRNIKLNQKR
jgi:hypothetical protein